MEKSKLNSACQTYCHRSGFGSSHCILLMGRLSFCSAVGNDFRFYARVGMGAHGSQSAGQLFMPRFTPLFWQ